MKIFIPPRFIITVECFLLVALISMFCSCKKDSEFKNSIPETSVSGQAFTNKPMTIEMAKAIFRQSQSSEILTQSSFVTDSTAGECLQFEPIWSMARELQTYEEIDIVSVPVAMPSEQVIDGRGAQLVFFNNENCTTPMELLLYEGKDYNSTRPFNIDNCSFTGTIATINFCDCTSQVFPVEDGTIITSLEWSFDSFEKCTESSGGSFRTDPDPDDGCDLDGDGFWQNLWDFLESIFEGPGNGGNGGIIWIYSGGYGGFPYYGGLGGSGGLGGPGGPSLPEINSIFDGTFFNGEGQFVINKLEDIIAQNDLLICTETFHQDLYHCFATTIDQEDIPGQPPTQGCGNNPADNAELNIDEYIRLLSLPSLSAACIADVSAQYPETNIDMEEGDGMLLCLIEDNNNFDMSDESLLDLLKTNCQGNQYCIEDAFACLARLDEFQNLYLAGTALDQTIVESVLNNTENICVASQETFEEKVFEQLAIYFSQNIDETPYEYEMPEGVEGLCWSSLVLYDIGEHYYVKISPFEVSFHHAQTNTWVEISFPSLCLSSNGKDYLTGDLMSVTDIKKGFTNAIEYARLGIFTQLNKGIVPLQGVVVLQFKASLFFNLKFTFSGLPSINTTETGCAGVPNSPVQWNCN